VSPRELRPIEAALKPSPGGTGATRKPEEAHILYGSARGSLNSALASFSSLSTKMYSRLLSMGKYVLDKS